MDKRYSYKIDKEMRIIFLSYKGDISIFDIMTVLKKLTTDVDYSPYFDEVSDFRNCNLHITKNEITMFIDFVKNQINIKGSRKNLYITKTPNHVVLTTLFSLLLKESPVKISIISSIELAISLLSRPELNQNKLKTILEEI